MLHLAKRGFTLIELLVVITIIGILATGAVTVYTSQMTKARDSTRLSDVKALQGAIEQAYMQNYQYPNRGMAFSGAIQPYMSRLPRDPRSTGTASGSALDYIYNTADDGTATTAVNPQRYELSVAFEQTAGTAGIPSSTADSGNDSNRHEVGVKNTTAGAPLNTAVNTAITSGVSGSCYTPAGAGGACSNANATLIK